MAIARTIIESEDASTVIDHLSANFPRFEDGWEAWKWRLSRDPNSDSFKVDDDKYIIKSDPEFSQYGMPCITILYSFNENEVTIIAIKVNNGE